MKERLTTGWNATRVIYLLLGMIVAVQAYKEGQWPGMLFGVYFAAMGLFAFGCAGGTCFGGVRYNKQSENAKSIKDIDFEEVK